MIVAKTLCNCWLKAAAIFPPYDSENMYNGTDWKHM